MKILRLCMALFCWYFSACVSVRNIPIQPDEKFLKFLPADTDYTAMVTEESVNKALDLLKRWQQWQRHSCDDFVTPPTQPSAEKCSISEYWEAM
jgi:hypothetical protein